MAELVHGRFKTFEVDGCCCVWCLDAVRIYFEATKPLGPGVQTTTGRIKPEAVAEETSAALGRLLANRPDLDLETIRLSRADFGDGLCRVTVQAHAPVRPG